METKNFQNKLSDEQSSYALLRQLWQQGRLQIIMILKMQALIL